MLQYFLLFLRLNDILYMYKPHFLCSFIYWWKFNFVHILAVVNKAALTLGDFDILIEILLDEYPEVWSLDLKVVLYLIFWGISILFPMVVALLGISTDKLQRFPFLYILNNTVVFCCFDNNHSNRCEVIPHCGFDLHFPDD